MFWIIVLVVVIAIVFFTVIISRKEKERVKAEEAAAKAKQERLIEELKTKAHAGDAAATKLLNYLEAKIDQPLVYGSTRFIKFRGLEINTVFSTAGNTLLQVIAESDGWDDFSIEKETDNTKNPKEGSMVCTFTAPSGERCDVTWGYDTKAYVFRTGTSEGHTGYDYIHASISLKTNSILVNAIVQEFEEKIIGFLKSQGAIPVCRTNSEAEARGLARFWNF